MQQAIARLNERLDRGWTGAFFSASRFVITLLGVWKLIEITVG